MGSPRTYIPAILVVANYLKKYVNKNSVTLKNRMGEGLFAIVVLAVDILIIVAELINAGHEAGDHWSDFTPDNVLSDDVLDSVKAAIDKFYATIGVTP